MKLTIQNFKCFLNKNIEINRLTVMAGANGNGKSTSIQALLFLRRTIEHCAKWDNKNYTADFDLGLNVELNGSYCLALGTSEQIVPQDLNEVPVVKFGLSTNKNKFNVEYGIGNGDELWLTPKKFTSPKSDMENISLFWKEFYYLNAERIGPRISQSVTFYDYPNVGWQGEYSAQILGSEFGYSFKVTEERREASLLTNERLVNQVNGWLGYIMNGVKIEAFYDTKTLSAQIKVSNNFCASSMSTNTGFGITCILPIIITGLIARRGAIMIVENPEAHLHPSAQSKIGRFLATIANAGINVIVETHSDHVINGIQIAAIKEEIDNDLITINYFSHNSEEKQPEVEAININDKGELSKWPKGFFDQTQIDFAELFKLRRND